MIAQETFLGPWPARTLESGLSIENHKGKSGLESPSWPGSQKCLLGEGTCLCYQYLNQSECTWGSWASAIQINPSIPASTHQGNDVVFMCVGHVENMLGNISPHNLNMTDSHKYHISYNIALLATMNVNKHWYTLTKVDIWLITDSWPKG